MLCATCKKLKGKGDFSNRQWLKPSGKERCKQCMDFKKQPGNIRRDANTLVCTGCHMRKGRADYDESVGAQTS